MFDADACAIKELSQKVLLLSNFCLFMIIWQLKQMSGSFVGLPTSHIISKDDGSNFSRIQLSL